jgi:alpha-galactosidase
LQPQDARLSLREPMPPGSPGRLPDESVSNMIGLPAPDSPAYLAWSDLVLAGDSAAEAKLQPWTLSPVSAQANAARRLGPKPLAAALRRAAQDAPQQALGVFGCDVTRPERPSQAPRTAALAVARPCDDGGPTIASRRTWSAQPRINGPRVFGVRPGSPFQYLIAATGAGPMRFSVADPLPPGLVLDPQTGTITGRTDQEGTYTVRLRATNPAGTAERTLRIEVGDEIALTPPMGINTWNAFADNIDQAKVRELTDAFVRLGLREHGYRYINIDDGWQGQRGADEAIRPNDRFEDLQGLIDYVHSQGLSFGIYHTPWKWSYAKYPGGSADPGEDPPRKPLVFIPHLSGWRVGSIHYDEPDAEYFANIGVDFLKHDWYRNDIPSTRRMSEALQAQPRDIVYSLSNTAPLANADQYEALANMFRTTADIRDAWDSNSPRDPFCLSIKEIWRRHERWADHNGPGHWADPDMLVVGPVGWGERQNGELRNRLSRDEQLSHMTLWCLWSAPLLVGCDLSEVDDFTLDMLCNDEVLEIDQDPLGKQATILTKRADAVVVSKELEDGSLAVGLFNTGPGELDVRVTWRELGLEPGVHAVRDLWLREDAGVHTEGLSATVREHGVKLFRVESASLS